MIDFSTLIKAGVHFGHQTSRWVPKMGPYIWGVKNKVHLIDVSKTAFQLERAAQFLKSVSADGKQILWVGTKKPAREIIQSIAKKLDMPYVNHRWIGGTLSNFSQVKKSVTRLLHFEDVLAKSEKYPHYTKKELNEIQKSVDRLKEIVGGIRTLTWPVGAIVLVDVNKEQSALREAVSVGVPVVALVDTNADPSLVDYVIPANDDAPRSIKVLLDYLEQAVQEGKKQAASKKAQAAAPKVEVVESEVVEVAETEEVVKPDKKEASTVEAKEKKVKAVAKSVKKEEKAEPLEEKPKAKKKAKATTEKKATTTSPATSKKVTKEKQSKAE